jgi:L-alanine-DL-glutamate epimerase-like enolase superfamily enzyme
LRVSTTVLEARWRAPLASAHGDGDQPRPLVLVELETPDGVVGYGEAAPLERYDGVSVAAVLDGLAACAEVLAGAPGDDRAATLAACATCTDLPQSLAAIDLALWDIAGRQRDQPVWELLGGVLAPQVAVNAVIGAVDPEAAAVEAILAVADGYRCLKLKVGVGDDLERTRAVRAAVGTEVALRVDANGTYAGVEAALCALAELEALGIELCEEPVHGAHGLAAVANGSSVAVAADESTTDPELFRKRCGTAMCLKIAAGGGISGVLAQAERARALGYELYLASTLDGPLGIAAALHAAAAVAPDRPCGLSTLDRFEPEAPPPFAVRGGHLSPPPGPGLGNALIDWYSQLSRVS